MGTNIEIINKICDLYKKSEYYNGNILEYKKHIMSLKQSKEELIIQYNRMNILSNKATIKSKIKKDKNGEICFE